MSDTIVIFVTAGSGEEASRIGRTLVEERLVACANVIAGVRSIYRWQDRIQEDGEFLVLLKTRRSLFVEVERRVRTLHSYEVPEVVAVDVAEGSGPYLEWVRSETRG